MDDTTHRMIELVCELFGIARADFMAIVREEAEAAGLQIREEALV